jgi:hypothetical protein
VIALPEPTLPFRRIALRRACRLFGALGAALVAGNGSFGELSRASLAQATDFVELASPALGSPGAIVGAAADAEAYYLLAQSAVSDVVLKRDHATGALVAVAGQELNAMPPLLRDGPGLYWLAREGGVSTLRGASVDGRVGAHAIVNDVLLEPAERTTSGPVAAREGRACWLTPDSKQLRSKRPR